ncbi:hypothetical protein [Rhizobium sp. ICMP 5592]|uniref:hypothetical protein n=1 Tax=Rhizobium sp. ICMP 5592 TaxID=2292445 RepID=UPI0012980E33|nr:hypothetical protein [Rhizobium sp. ICMP 5592]MQB43378.1 hypothetical protein [Rhizobium sp. ICMP 5592]
MSGDEGENLGHPVAHTPGENAENSERAAKIGATRATTEAAMAGLAQAIAPEAEPEQQSLLLDEIDDQQCLFRGPVKHVASTLEAANRARGRPKGSQNKASKEFAQTLMRMGFKHPGLNLAALANADPVALALELACIPIVGSSTPDEAMTSAILVGLLKRDDVITLMDKAHGMIRTANAELLPYFESKKPQPKDPGDNDRPLGVMVISQMNIVQADDKRTIDITRFDTPDE